MKLPFAFYLYFYSSCLPIISAMTSASLVRRDTRVLYLLLVLGLGFTLGEIWFALQHVNNLWLFHVYRLLCQVVLTFIFYTWTAGPLAKKIMKWSLIAFILLWGVAKVTFEPLSGWDTYTSTVSNIMLVAICAYLLFSLSQSIKGPTLRGYQVAIVAAVLVGAIGDSLIFAFGNTFVRLSGADARQLYTIHWLVTTLANLIFTWAFWLKFWETKTSLAGPPITQA